MMNFAFKTSNSFIVLHPNDRWPSEHNYLLCSTLKKNKDFVFKKLTKLKNMVHSWEFLKCTIWNKEYMCKMLSLLTSEKCFHWCIMWLFFLVPMELIKQTVRVPTHELCVDTGPASCENWPCIPSVLKWSLKAIYIPNFLLKSDDTTPKGLIFWTRKFVGEGNKEGGGHGRRGHGILTLKIISVKIFLSTVDSWKIIIPVYPHGYS